MREPFYQDQYDQEHLKPSISKLLLSPEVYCRAHALLVQAHGVSATPSQGPAGDAEALLQLLEKKGLGPQLQGADVTREELSCVPIKMVGGGLQRLPVTSAHVHRQTLALVFFLVNAESPSRHDRCSDDVGCETDCEPGQDGGGGGADGRRGAVGERFALLGQQCETRTFGVVFLSTLCLFLLQE